MRFQIIQPSANLSLYIKQYWHLEMEAFEGENLVQRVVPNGFIELTFHFSDRLIKRTETDELQPSILLSGHHTRFFDVIPTGKIEMLSIQFFPHSINLFFEFPANELSNTTLNLNDAIGKSAKELEEQVYGSQSLGEKVAIIENFLLRRLSREPKYSWQRIVNNINSINITNGQVSPGQLASEACLSRKQHERIFKEFVGLSPKKYLKTIRFQYALFVHQKNPNESLTELAFRCGYYDLSHMINDFKELSGITPRQYFTECETSVSDYF